MVIVQPFLTRSRARRSRHGLRRRLLRSAIPLLAALIMLNEEETFRRRLAMSRFVEVAKAAAQLLAFVGVVAACWHILWIAGVGVLAASAVGLAVHSVGFTNLGRIGPEPSAGGAVADPERGQLVGRRYDVTSSSIHQCRADRSTRRRCARDSPGVRHRPQTLTLPHEQDAHDEQPQGDDRRPDDRQDP